MGQSLKNEMGGREVGGVNDSAAIRVRPARTAEQFAQVARLRYLCYLRAIPSLADSVSEPDDADRSDRAVVLLAECTATGMPLATMRIEYADANYYVPRDLLKLPDHIRVEATTYYSRLAAVSGRLGTAAKMSMVKAAARYSLALGKPWVLAAAPPSRRRNYSMLGLHPLNDVAPVPMPGFPHIQLSLLGGNLFDAERASRQKEGAFLRYIFDPVAPEIELFEPIARGWEKSPQAFAPTRFVPSCAPAFDLAVV